MFFFQDTPVSPSAGASSAAAAMQQMSVGEFLRHEDPLGWVVVITLCLMSVSSWYFIIANAIRNSMVKSRADKVINGFWNNPSTQDAIRELEAQPKSEPFSKIALDAASAVAHHQQASAGGGRLAESLSRSEFIDRALRQAVDRESLRLEGGMTLLATVGSAAPFVGLLGTVWGIYHALIRISASGNASMEAVAGPVGEALIMTAFGLFAAIPAVFAYNFFSRANRLTYARFDEFAHDLHDFFATGSRVEGK
ncbi:MotA/TolQ/ExbB proton channel family protein [Fulvimonas sp. R45]|jgi:biopolymer transport protein ExbB|uniref:MotA/TolQ/ExbB proton channel family protein n=1 Tax=Fulvimonas sp. R45 TaxID=3045937 RepID=UPI00265FF0B2|nr:MotA/TolQ/ExbB proton channel family protein [Fulvimonas sp. R45]MDO1529420.1 MotA/TolQ/ExbB proton channel family protein [Fulvimonas sp. R45]